MSLTVFAFNLAINWMISKGYTRKEATKKIVEYVIRNKRRFGVDET